MVKEVCMICRFNTRPIELNNLQRIIKLVKPKVNLKTIKNLLSSLGLITTSLTLHTVKNRGILATLLNTRTSLF